MIILRMHNGHVVGGACTKCHNSGKEGILMIPDELDIPVEGNDSEEVDEFLTEIIEVMSKALKKEQ